MTDERTSVLASSFTAPKRRKPAPSKRRGRKSPVDPGVFRRAYKASRLGGGKLSVAAAARRFEIPVRTLWRWIQKGHPDAQKSAK